MANYIRKFETISQYVSYLNNTPYSQHYTEDSRSSHNGTESFTGTESYEQANNLLIFGDKANLDKLSQEMVKINSHKGECTKHVIYSDTWGFMPNVVNYINGLPQNMYNVRQQKYLGGTKIVNIIFNVGVDCSWTTSKIIECGAKVLSAVSLLEKQGYRVNLYTFSVSKSGAEKIAVAVRIKRSDDRMNLMKTAYPLVNPSWERRHFFKFIESANVNHRFSGYGSVVRKFEDVKDILKDLCIKCDYYLDMYSIKENGVNLGSRVSI